MKSWARLVFWGVAVLAYVDAMKNKKSPHYKNHLRHFNTYDGTEQYYGRVYDRSLKFDEEGKPYTHARNEAQPAKDAGATISVRPAVLPERLLGPLVGEKRYTARLPSQNRAMYDKEEINRGYSSS